MNREEATRKNLEGLKSLESGEYDEAIGLFSEAIELDADYPAPWLGRSEANGKSGREAEARADRERWSIVFRKQQEGIDRERSTSMDSRLKALLRRLELVGKIKELDSQHLLITPGFLKWSCRVTVDRTNQSIFLDKKLFLFISRKQIIPFSDIISVVLHYQQGYSQWNNEEEWCLVLKTPGEKIMLFSKFGNIGYETITQFATVISEFIGKELEYCQKLITL